MYYLLCCFFNLLLRFFVDTHSFFSLLIDLVCIYIYFGKLRVIFKLYVLIRLILGMESPLRYRGPIRGIVVLYQLVFVSTVLCCSGTPYLRNLE